jgi:hypothetical protein
MFNGSKIKLAVSTGLAAAGLGIAALAAVPAYAVLTSPGTTTANVGVANTITLSGLTAAFTLSGAPATTQTGLTAVTMNVKSDNRTGYNVTVQAAAATMAGATIGNLDTIPVSALTVRNTKTGGAYTAISTLSAATVANSAVRSPVGGDTINNDYQVVIPWVNADTYSVTLNYLASNNP